MPYPKCGLRVRYHDHVEMFSGGRHGQVKILAAVKAGWFIEVMYGNKYHALMDLRFKREKDALRAAQSLTAAGLDSHGALMRADPVMVKKVACENLWW